MLVSFRLSPKSQDMQQHPRSSRWANQDSLSSSGWTEAICPEHKRLQRSRRRTTVRLSLLWRTGQRRGATVRSAAIGGETRTAGRCPRSPRHRCGNNQSAACYEQRTTRAVAVRARRYSHPSYFPLVREGATGRTNGRWRRATAASSKSLSAPPVQGAWLRNHTNMESCVTLEDKCIGACSA